MPFDTAVRHPPTGAGARRTSKPATVVRLQGERAPLVPAGLPGGTPMEVVVVQYLILAAEDEAAFASRDDAELSGPYWNSWQAYIAALTESGVLRGAGGLEPSWTATTVRLREGKRLVQDGPFADSKEQLGGYFLIEVDDLDTALDWAARCPSAEYASVEVRPLLPPPTGT